MYRSKEGDNLVEIHYYLVWFTFSDMKMNRPDIQEENVHLKAIYMCGHAKIIAAWRAGWNISIILF